MSRSKRVKMKKCGGEKGCEEFFPATEEYFYRHGGGLGSICRECHKKYLAEYRSRPENKARIKEWQAEYYEANRELCLDKLGHKCVWPGCKITQSEFLAFDHINDDGEEHREEIGKYGQAIIKWLIENNFPKDKIQLLCHNHNWIKRLLKSSSNLLQDPGNKATRKYAAKIRLEVFTYYGLICACCGEANLDLLTIDHILGGGNKHRRKIGNNICNWLKRKGFPPSYRTLCHNCNKSLGSYGNCPHGN